ncbi:TatD family deoxyribonuclease [Candidatus Parvarchaeota archaeon]|nr:TatD family deoxyribonuclease [Candidatus Parvarchaeota archaeon]
MDNAKILVFDAHCHLESFEKAGMAVAIDPGHFVATSGYSSESNMQNKKIRDANPQQICLSCGIAPQEAMKHENLDEKMPLWIDFIMASKPNAIGEIGLDFHWAKTQVEKDRQYVAFRAQLGLAAKIGLPVVIHCRDAMKETLDELEKAQKECAKQGKKLDFMMHCFSGKPEDALRACSLGGIISIPPMRSKERKKAIKAVFEQGKQQGKSGLEKFVVETDSPYLGTTKTLSDINISLQIIADATGESLDCVKKASCENAIRFYWI